MFYLDDEKRQEDQAQSQSVEAEVQQPDKAENTEAANPAESAENQAQGQDVPAEGEASTSQDQSPDTYSAVTLAANRRKFIVIGVVAAAIATLYFVYNSANQAVQQDSGPMPQISPEQVERAISSSQPVTPDLNQGSSSNIAEIPRAQLPDLTQLQEPEPPAPPPPPEPVIPQTPNIGGPAGPGTVPAPNFNPSSGGGRIFEGQSQQEREAIIARRSEAIIVLGGGASQTGALGEGGEAESEEKKDNSGFLGFGDGQLEGDVFSKTSSSQVKVTKIGNMTRMIAQGKVIHAVLETAINTDIPGTLRAVITRDVYAESGKRILIPKGSRLIGEYEAQVRNGQTRVPIMWNRVLLPSGFDVALDSPGTDRLGRSGVPGKLDNKFWTRMGSAFLVSLVIPYSTYKLSDVGSSETTSSTSTATDGTVTTTNTGDTESQLVKDSAEKFSDIATEIVKSSFSETPTITINQGELVKVFVNQDIIFPTAEYMNQQRFAR